MPGTAHEQPCGLLGPFHPFLTSALLVSLNMFTMCTLAADSDSLYCIMIQPSSKRYVGTTYNMTQYTTLSVSLYVRFSLWIYFMSSSDLDIENKRRAYGPLNEAHGERTAASTPQSQNIAHIGTALNCQPAVKCHAAFIDSPFIA